MNESEARSKIKYRIEVAREIAGSDSKSVEDLEIAVQVLKEIREYRELGSVEELKAFRSNDFTQDLLNMGYTKGLKDGYARAIDEFAEALLRCDVIDKSVIRRIAEQMKGEQL